MAGPGDRSHCHVYLPALEEPVAVAVQNTEASPVGRAGRFDGRTTRGAHYPERVPVNADATISAAVLAKERLE